MLQQTIQFFKKSEKTTVENDAIFNNVKEKDCTGQQKKIFTAADLWDIQRNSRNSLSRRRIF